MATKTELDDYTYTKQTLSQKLSQETKKNIINDKRLKSPKKYNNYKYIYASNIRAINYMKQTLTELKKEIVSNNSKRFQFNTPLSLMDRISRKKYQ